jgi:hypothetical protein
MGKLTHGLAAGAVGTALINASTYLDMAVRGRPPSSIPEQDVDRLAERAGISLGDDDDERSARRTGLGSLLGYVAGFGTGAAYGVVRPFVRWVPRPLAAALVGVGAMAATDASSAALGTTDPRSWTPGVWAADLIPHLVYGAGVVATFDALER